MPKNYKILGQVAPAATTNTDIYTVPANAQAIVSTIVVANRSASAATYRIATRLAGEALANKHYIAYDVLVAPNDSTTLTLGITLATTDIITVYASSADTAFNVFGSEITS